MRKGGVGKDEAAAAASSDPYRPSIGTRPFLDLMDEYHLCQRIN